MIVSLSNLFCLILAKFSMYFFADIELNAKSTQVETPFRPFSSTRLVRRTQVLLARLARKMTKNRVPLVWLLHLVR